MSALVTAPSRRTRAPKEAGTDESRRPALRPLASPSRRMARLPFLVVLIAAFGLGMAGLLLLNTTLQNQEFEARRLASQASQLTYVQDDLQAQLQTLSAPGSLAQKAYEAGLRPNTHPAFLVLPDGTVEGKAGKTTGDEMPNLVPGTGEELTADRAAKEAAAKAEEDGQAGQDAQPTTTQSTTVQPSAEPSATR